MCVCIGLDVHAKKTTGFAVPLDGYNEEGLDFCREFKTFGADRAELERMAEWLKDMEHSILIENSTKTHEVFWIIVDAGYTVVVANANDLYRITKSVKKTDHHDSEELAHYMRRRLLGGGGSQMVPGEASQIIWPFCGNDGERRRPSLHSGRLFDYSDKPTCNHQGTAVAISITIPSFLKSGRNTMFSYTRDHDVCDVDHFRSQII